MYWKGLLLSLLLISALAVNAQKAASESSDESSAKASETSESSSAAKAPSASEASSESAGPSTSSSVADPLSFGSLPQQADPLAPANTLPPYTSLNAEATTTPALGSGSGVSLDLARRIRQTEELLNRMVWQLNRETAWANSVHDIIQNYQYKYTKVLQNIKKHQAASSKMRDLVATLKKARLHEILEADLAKATDELTELASNTEASTSESSSSYSSLKDRLALMKQDVEKMKNERVNLVLRKFQDGIKEVATDAVPPASADTLRGLVPKSSSSNSTSSL